MQRRHFLKDLSFSTVSLLAMPGMGNLLPTGARPLTANDFVDAETAYGKVRGTRTNGVNIFRGIPYAGKVSGERRFRRPAPLEPWRGIREALEFGPPSVQPPRQNEPAPAEDCLFLNIWTPANDGKKRPVMFYSHGGGFVIGSGASSWQNGANLARYFDVVVVQTNHRLGLLGFLYLDELAGPDYAGSGNMGTLDITAGLKWVHENIAEFGGDPDNVMIFGESGGGAKTSCLYAMPEAAPYFNKASIESGPGVRMTTPDAAAATTALVLKELNIDPKNWRKLLEVPAADLLAVQSKIPNVPPSLGRRKKGSELPTGFGPVVDGRVLPHHPFDPKAPKISRDKPLMVGWNEDEYTFFAWQSRDVSFTKIDFDGLRAKLEPQYGTDTPKIIDTYRKANPKATAPEIFIAVASINMMGLGSVVIAERKTKQGGAPVYLYNFGYKSEVKIPGSDYALGTPHAMDITFKFNNEVPPEKGGQESSFFGGSSPDRYKASHQMAELWTTFARTGTPAAEGVPAWPAYTRKNRATMRIDTECEVIEDRFAEELKMWRSIGKLS
ncbi:carboxylesterase/lipase family protein [Flavilitoribacter nigricans]|uniref:Carboxylic ester hydrolase n=1 Tax=Flavilitoribacter nigricans (strain ATCC 23147 / DSM 23189 / NBRC 102662 / NCIMB 1420 / SS-2) TaxID=1122177 RepID=A0A2D0NEC2_FLAN2|nr:carboxylesterase/lipase family protein [Flavilitoribacter nigricans]PHN06827.1 carboxylesterase [Flavilitoribacter nigricans DSM 23189 = NBRC 102662]